MPAIKATNIGEVVSKLKADIKILRDPQYGYLYAGLPRFPAFFGRDSCIVSWQLISYDLTIARRSLDLLVKLQGKKIDNIREEEPGKIVHEWHPNPAEYKPLPWPLPYYGSVDSTPLFIFLCGLYFEKSSDIDWLTTNWPHIVFALDWCEKYGDFNGDIFLEYERKNPNGLFDQGWKDKRTDHLGLKPPVAIVEVQGYYFAALCQAAKLASKLNDKILATQLIERSEELKKKFLEKFWLPEKKFFTIASPKSKIPDTRIVSNPGHLLFCGILDGENDKIQALVTRLFKEDMWTPYGIRTHATSNPDFDPMSYHLGSIWPHDNWICAQGLKKYGYNREYEKIKQALLNAYYSLGEIPELYTAKDGRIEKIPNACSPQAWASGALLNFITR